MFVAGKHSREQAVAIAAELDAPYKDVGGVHSQGELAIRTALPDALLNAALVRRTTTAWHPPTKASSASDFVKLLDEEIGNIGLVEEALLQLLGVNAETLAAKVIDAMSDAVTP